MPAIVVSAPAVDVKLVTPPEVRTSQLPNVVVDRFGAVFVPAPVKTSDSVDWALRVIAPVARACVAPVPVLSVYVEEVLAVSAVLENVWVELKASDLFEVTEPPPRVRIAAPSWLLPAVVFVATIEPTLTVRPPVKTLTPLRVSVPEPFLTKVPAPPVATPPLLPTAPEIVILPAPPMVKVRAVPVLVRPKVESNVSVGTFTTRLLLASLLVAAPENWIG